MGDQQVLRSVAAEIAAASREGVEVAVVVGGGNFFRGINAWDGLERATADYMGMLATCMNAICLQVRSNRHPDTDAPNACMPVPAVSSSQSAEPRALAAQHQKCDADARLGAVAEGA